MLSVVGLQPIKKRAELDSSTNILRVSPARYASTQILSQIVRAVAMSNALLCAWLTGDTRKIFVSDIRRRRVQLGARLGRL